MSNGDLEEFKPGAPSPCIRLLCLGWYDGPTSGVAATSGGRLYRFELLDRRPDADDLRVFAFAPLPGGAWDRLVEAIEGYQEPRWPVFVPTWKFATPGELERLDRLAVEVLDTSGEPVYVVAAEDLMGEIVAARVAAGPAAAAARLALTSYRLDVNGARGFQWFDYLGIGSTPVDAFGSAGR